MRVSYSVCSGVGKQACEDTALIENVIVNNCSGVLNFSKISRVLLCDGIGGYEGGREASHFVAEGVCRMNIPCSEEKIKSELFAVNNDLFKYSEQMNKKRMGTTLTGLLFSSEISFLVNAGNSRVYTIKEGYLRQITDDQTTYQMYMSMGYYDFAKSCRKSEIMCAFGGGSPNFLNMLSVKKVFNVKIPEIVLMTTDGVHDYLSFEQIEKIINEKQLSPYEKVLKLTESAEKSGSQDDRSAIIIEF